MSKIFDHFNKSAKDGSFQEWLRTNPEGNPVANSFLLRLANAIRQKKDSSNA